MTSLDKGLASFLYHAAVQYAPAAGKSIKATESKVDMEGWRAKKTRSLQFKCRSDIFFDLVNSPLGPHQMIGFMLHFEKSAGCYQIFFGKAQDIPASNPQIAAPIKPSALTRIWDPSPKNVHRLRRQT